MKKLILLFFPLLVLSLVGGFFYYQINLQPAGGEEEVVFVINRGDSSRSIAQRLKKQGLIKNEYVFLIYLQLTNQAKKLQAGSFRLSVNDSVPEIVNQLQYGRIDVWVTFIEGYRREQYAELLNEKMGLSIEEFLSLTEGKEGRLFPDSYLLPNDILVPQVIKKLTDNFQEKWSELDNQTGFSQNEVLILASLVEREVKLDKDRKIVSGILIKRLEDDWPLQVDASVQYVKGDADNWWPKISGSDLRDIDSPYNTYLYKGIPPAPICNPSLSSIKAVINFQPTDYWYYLSDQQGNIHYARSLEDHNANIKNYLE